MSEKLYTKPSILSRHKKAPYKEERERYLRHCCWGFAYHLSRVSVARFQCRACQSLPLAL